MMLSLTVIREVRKACGLEPDSFYDWGARMNSLIHQHQGLLVRLGRR
jgi:hypothetical protein